MTTLAKRATPAQAKIMRIIEGAVLNTQDAHGEPRNERNARSIAKRAAGTISSQWRDVLAANSPSDNGAVSAAECRTNERCTHPCEVQRSGKCVKAGHGTQSRRGSSHGSRRSPLEILWSQFAREMWKYESDPIRKEMTVELLRAINKLQKELGG